MNFTSRTNKVWHQVCQIFQTFSLAKFTTFKFSVSRILCKCHLLYQGLTVLPIYYWMRSAAMTVAYRATHLLND